MIESLRVLVLNSSFEPLHFCTARRAITMVFTGRAQQLENDGIIFHSFSAQFACPTVIKLNRYVKVPYRKTLPFSKKNVMRRDHHTCQYCGQKRGELTIDHIRPRSLGGESSWLNVVAACKPCNTKKGNRSPHEAGLELRREPFKPHHMTLLFEPQSVPESFTASWKKYLSTNYLNN